MPKFLGSKSISVTTLLVIVLMITMSLWNLISYYKDMRGKSAENIEFQKKMIVMTLQNVENVLKAGQEDAALTIIDANYASTFYDFFIVYKKNQLLTQSSNIGEFALDRIPTNAADFEIKGKSQNLYMYRKQVDNYDLVLGYFPADISKLSMSEILRLLSHNIQDTIILFIAIAGLVLREYFKQIKLIKQGKREDFEKLNPLTTEGKLLRDLFLHASNLTRQKIELEIPDGVEMELTLGTKDRAVFKGGLIRIDLNQYSTYCKELGTPTVDSLISPIFNEFRELAQRYGFYEVADEGDERVFYLRSDNAREATQLGISVIRGFFEVGQLHAGPVKAKYGIDLHFKGAFVFEDLLFLKEDGKYKMKGDGFILSKRCLGTFKTRAGKEEVFVMPASLAAYSADLVEISKNETWDMQGVGGYELYYGEKLESHPPQIQNIPYYRSNGDITHSLQALLKKWSDEVFWAFYNTLKNFKSIQKDPHHAELLLQLLKQCQSTQVSQEIVASFMMLFPKLIPPSELKPDVLTYLKTFLKSENPRVKANALEAMGELEAAVTEARLMIGNEDNRTRANAMVILGKSEINPEVEKNVRQFLKSGSDNQILSGLYVIDKVFSHHSMKDLTIFKTSTFFRSLFEDVQKLKGHSSERVASKVKYLTEMYQDLIS